MNEVFKKKVNCKYNVVIADFKSVELKFIDQDADKSLVQEYIDKFKKLRDKNKLPTSDKNIDTWGKSSFQDFKKFIDNKEKLKTISEEKKLIKHKNAKLIAENDGWRIYHITDHKACKLYGSNTKWCITQSDGIEWSNYDFNNNIYFLISKNLPSDNPWFKIALLVNEKGTKTYWDALDKDHSSVPSSLHIPNFTAETFELETEEKQLNAVNKNGSAIKFIDNSSKEVQLAAVNNSGNSIQFIKEPSEDVQMAAVKNYGFAISYLKNPSQAVQIAAVDNKGNAIRYIDNPTEEIQLTAVKNNGAAIKYIKNPSEAVQLEAVRHSDYYELAIQFIQNPSELVQLEAVKASGRAISFLENPSEIVMLEAVKKDWSAVKYIKTPPEAVQIEAVKRSAKAIDLIKNPTEKVKELAAKSQYPYWDQSF